MKCLTCGNDNSEDAQFCGVCGTNLSSDEISVGPELPMVGFGEAISRGFSNYFTFSGRARRSEYWFWVLFSTLVQAIPLVGGLIGLAVLIPSIAVTSRRLHDIGKTGWWQLLIFLVATVTWVLGIVLVVVIAIMASDSGDDAKSIMPMIVIAVVSLIAAVVVTVWWIFWMARKGDTGPNKYGPDPRQPTSQ